VANETRASAGKATQVRKLPHRYPFLLIDRVIDIRGEDHGIGIKNVTMNEAHFAGHFPDNPVMPGVLMVEGLAQTAAVLVLRPCRPACCAPTSGFLATSFGK
jgi:3-hydroxyacyl-[acyl-carrier-protein] dehydratase